MGLRFLLLLAVGWLVSAFVRVMARRYARPGSGSRGPQGRGPWTSSPGTDQATWRAQQSKSPYDVLGVRPGAPREEIDARYRELVREYHPDKVAHMAPEFREVAERRMKEINTAYDHIKRYG